MIIFFPINRISYITLKIAEKLSSFKKIDKKKLKNLTEFISIAFNQSPAVLFHFMGLSEKTTPLNSISVVLHKLTKFIS